MAPLENEPLARHTTLHLGGPARFFVTCSSSEEVVEAYAFAKEKGLRFLPLGAGSNVLVSDEGVQGVVAHITIPGISFIEQDDAVLVTAGAGVLWDELVDAVAARQLWGIENLAGIPGTVGGAAVQNIGAYGSELESVFVQATVVTEKTGNQEIVTKEHAAFAYRSSFFKYSADLCIVDVTLRLQKKGIPHTAYPDLAAVSSDAQPEEVARAVRSIRAKKFPSLAEEGTAGSFFKNPSLTAEEAARLSSAFLGLPAFPQGDGTVKIPLAWILDVVLGLKGYEKDGVRLFENQPLILVAKKETHAKAVDALAEYVAEKVFAATGIVIEREVESFGGK